MLCSLPQMYAQSHPQQPIHLNHIQEENEMLNYKSYVNVTASIPCHVCNEYVVITYGNYLL